jgi:hypothetical protein
MAPAVSSASAVLADCCGDVIVAWSSGEMWYPGKMGRLGAAVAMSSGRVVRLFW